MSFRKKMKSSRKEPNILITGTPGVGKSTLAKRLVEDLNFEWINVGEVALKEKCIESHDEKYGCPILDEDKVVDILEDRVVNGGKILDYHGSDFFPERWIDLVIVLRTDNTKLFDRLSLRGYSDKKLTENIDCEIFGTLSEEAYDSYRPSLVHSMQSNTEEDIEINLKEVKRLVGEWRTKNSTN